ncbi:hypothetical protein ACLMJK_006520 [Lecanora helva]
MVESSKLIFVIGGPSVGKGTHCKQLANDLGLMHVSVGDLLRAEAKNPTVVTAEDRRTVTDSMRAGQLAPSKLAVKVLETYLRRTLLDPARGKVHFLVDGFPRSMEQLEDFEIGSWDFKGLLHFDAPEETMQARMHKRAGVEHRTDDNVETHRKRLRDFKEQSPPIIGFHAEKELYYKVN